MLCRQQTHSCLSLLMRSSSKWIFSIPLTLRNEAISSSPKTMKATWLCLAHGMPSIVEHLPSTSATRLPHTRNALKAPARPARNLSRRLQNWMRRMMIHALRKVGKIGMLRPSAVSRMHERAWKIWVISNGKDFMPTPINLVFSYARADNKLREKLEQQLSILKRQGYISTWHAACILPGEPIAKEIVRHMQEAHIILLLVSPAFLASDYCYGHEMKMALRRHEAEEVHIIPVLFRPTFGWQNTPFGQLQMLPSDG